MSWHQRGWILNQGELPQMVLHRHRTNSAPPLHRVPSMSGLHLVLDRTARHTQAVIPHAGFQGQPLMYSQLPCPTWCAASYSAPLV